ncbi:MAG: BON domain-containing protein [Desulfovibrio sp.]|jgi:osmotically-inducible protein OsmY|nr:BON domain-containing protein [Desulfovibrio sp.]
MQRFLVFLLLAAVSCLDGCAYGLYEDQRLMDTIVDDKAMSGSIKSALFREDFTDGWSVAVYCYYKNVFLVGEVPENMQRKAVETARRHRPRSVTPHWFAPAESKVGDIELAATLRKELIGTKGLSSTRIDTEVNAGRVVLLGVVKSDEEKRLAVQAARKTNGVHAVTSYLMLPQRVK